MQIVKNLWQVGGPDLTSEEDAAVFLVRFGAAAALIDSGCGDAHRRLIDNVSAVLPADSEIELLLLTHCHYDHVGGAGGLREHYGCRIVAHELDAAYLEAGDSEVTAASWYGARLRPLPIDRKLARAHETLVLGDGEIEAYHCPDILRARWCTRLPSTPGACSSAKTSMGRCTHRCAPMQPIIAARSSSCCR